MLRLAAPLVGAQLLQMAVFAVDVLFIARLGARPLAASALAVGFFGLLMWSLTGLVGAASPLIATELGRRAPHDHPETMRAVRGTVGVAGWIGLAAALATIALCQAGGAAMRVTGQSPAVIALAEPFLALLSLSALPMVMAALLRTVVATLGRPALGTWINGMAVAVNALGNYTLVFGHFGLPAMGLNGSALSSILTNLAMLLAYVVALRLDPRLHGYHMLGGWWQPDLARAADVLRIGLPIAATIVAEAGLFNGAAYLMGRIGDAQLAAHSIALQFFSTSFMVPYGLAQAATIRVGLAHGARDAAGVARAGRTALILGLGFMTCTAALYLCAARPLLGLYLDTRAPANAAVVYWALRFMAIGAAFQLFDGAQTVLCGNLRGLHDTRWPMVIALAGYWVFGLGTAIGLGLFTPLGGVGVWLGFLIGLGVVAVLLALRWHRRARLGLVS